MKDKLEAIEKQVALEKLKSKDCSARIKKSLESLQEAIAEGTSEEEETEVLVGLGGSDGN